MMTFCCKAFNKGLSDALIVEFGGQAAEIANVKINLCDQLQEDAALRRQGSGVWA